MPAASIQMRTHDSDGGSLALLVRLALADSNPKPTVAELQVGDVECDKL
jgi:hypothetical protein